MKRLDAAAAAALIGDGATVAVSGGGYRAVAETVLAAIAERFRREGTPKGIRLVAVAMLERSRGGVGGEGTGLNRLAQPGLMDTLITSSFSRARERELNRLIRDDEVAAYNYPMGTIVQWLRAIGTGQPGLLTGAGIGTFVDPRVEGGRSNRRAEAPLNRVVELAGEEMLYYPAFKVDVGLIKASAADERGNLYMERQVFEHGAIDVAMAVRASRGTLVAEVNRIVRRGELPAKLVRIPGAMVDAVVVDDAPAWEDEQAPYLLGDTVLDIPAPKEGGSARDVIAEIALSRLAHGTVVNLGAGVPMYDVPEAARRAGRDDIYFTIEQGPTGGWPMVGGVARNPDAMMGQLEVFQFYEGGGPDISVLSFGEVDAKGNVNVSKFGPMMPGCGGFVNIVHGIRHILFCGTLTTGGLALSIGEGKLGIENEGRIRRFVPEVEQITFNAPLALAKGHTVEIVTERAHFAVTGEGFRLVAVAPGVDVARDILALVPFPVSAPADVPTLDAAFYRGAAAAGG